MPYFAGGVSLLLGDFDVQKSRSVLANGAFGIATNAKGETEYFWGFDHLGQVVDHLGIDRPAAGGVGGEGGWKAML